MIKDTFGPAGSDHRLVHCHILDGLLIGFRQSKVGLLGTHFCDIVVTIGMLAAMVNVLLMNTVRVAAVYTNSQEFVLKKRYIKLEIMQRYQDIISTLK